jgi:CopC domain
MRRLLVGAAALFLALINAPLAAAQTPGPQYRGSEPGRGETLHRAPGRVTIRFDTPLDSSSEMNVFNECGDGVSGATSVSGFEMSAPVSGEWAGDWMVRYSADGVGPTGSTAGTFSFFVHAGPSCKGPTTSSGHDHGGGDSKPRHGNHETMGSGLGGHGGGHSSSGGDHGEAGHSSGGRDHATHMSDGSHQGGFGHAHDKDQGKGHGGHGKAGDGRHAGGHGQNSPQPDAADSSPTLWRLSPEMNLGIALLVPALAGVAGGFVLRRRFTQA